MNASACHAGRRGGSPMRGVQAVALGRGTRKQAVGLLASRFPPPLQSEIGHQINIRWRAFGALPTDTGKPRGAADRAPPDGRLPLPRRGPGGCCHRGRSPLRTTDRKLPGPERHGRVMWVSRGGVPIGLPIGGYHHGTNQTCRKPSSGSTSGNRRTGHASLTREGEVPVRARPSRTGRTTSTRCSAGFPGALVVVDQSRNIGAARARPRQGAPGMPRGVPAGTRRARGRQALRRRRQDRRARRDGHREDGAGHPRRAPAGRRPAGPTIEAARALAAQRNFLTCENTRNKNRLRSILLESCPAFEALRRPVRRGAQLRLMASLGGAVVGSRRRRRRRPSAALTRGGGARQGRGALVRLDRTVLDKAASGGRRLPRTAPCGCSRAGYPRTPPEIEALTGGDLGPARGRRDLPVPPHGAGHRAEDRFRAGRSLSTSKTSPVTTGSRRTAAWRRATASREPRSPR